MINIKEGQLSRNIGKTIRKTRGNREKGGLSQLSSEIIIGDNQLLKKLE
jgi:hypothetical protein